jgi:hypothetical protein
MDVFNTLREKDAVLHIDEECRFVRVRPYGNCSVFGLLARTDGIRPGNVAVFQNGDLKVNYVTY